MKESEKKKLAIKLIASELSQSDISDTMAILRSIRDAYHYGLKAGESIEELIMTNLSHDEMNYLMSEKSENVFEAKTDTSSYIAKNLGLESNDDSKPIKKLEDKPWKKNQPKVAYTLTYL